MIELDARKMERKGEAHEYLKEQMAFPEYYGKNLDALHDCLTSLPPTKVRFCNTDQVNGGYFDKIMRVFRDSAQENPGLEICE